MGTDSSGSGEFKVSFEQRLSQTDEELSELRGLLLSPEQEKLATLQRRLDDPRLQAEDMSRALPQAVELSATHGDQLGRALMPTVEQAVRVSVKKDSRVLVEALFPVMGPAIRRAIASALRGMVESLDKVLRQSFSIQGFRWRLEALRTGRSFAEIALLHSLVYRVEQVFLIHKQTGLLLQHLVADHVAVQDGDMVSGMLTAIQDFVKDSFHVQDGSELETLQVGPLSVFVEQGPYAVLATVVRGNAPQEFRQSLQETLEQIHSQESAALESFQGDALPFGSVHDLLARCLQARYQAQDKKTSPLLWALFAAVLIAIGLWTISGIRERSQWNAYVDRLRQEDGLVVTFSGKLAGKHHVTGLRDPLAADPAKILAETRLDPANVTSRWEAYESLQPRFVLARAGSLLQLPETVSLRVENGILMAAGIAPRQWIADAARLAPALPGISRFEGSQLLEMEKKLEDERRKLETQVIRFQQGTTEYAQGEVAAFADLRQRVRTLDQYARLLHQSLNILLVGHADSSGSENTNSRLSQERAEKARKDLVTENLRASAVQAEGAGSRKPMRAERSDDDRSYNRSVSFQITLRSLPQ